MEQALTPKIFFRKKFIVYFLIHRFKHFIARCFWQQFLAILFSKPLIELTHQIHPFPN